MSNPLEKISTQDLLRWLILALTIAVPLVYHQGFDAAFTMPKLLTLRFVTLLIVAIAGIQLFAQGEFKMRRSPLNKWIAAYAAVLLLTTVTSVAPWVSFFGDQTRFIGLATWLNLLFVLLASLTLFQSKREVEQWVNVSAWTAVVVAAHALLQARGWFNATGWSLDPTARAFGTLGHSNHLGAYLAFSLFLMSAVFRNARSLTQKSFAAVGLLLIAAAILSTASRGALLAVVAGAVLMIGAWVLSHRKRLKKIARNTTIALVAFVFALVLFQGPLSRLEVVQRTVDTLEFIQAGNVPDRISWAHSAVAMFRDHPVLGHGLGTFRMVYNEYRRTDYRVPGDIQDGLSPEAAHMEYLDIAATQGGLGLFIYLGLIVAWARLMIRLLRDRDLPLAQRNTALALFAAGVTYLVQVVLSFGVVGTMVPFVVLIGVSSALYHIQSDPKPQAEQFVTWRLRRFTKLAVVSVVLVLTVFGAWFTYRGARAEWMAQQGDRAREQQEVADMLEAYRRSTVYMPWLHEYWQKYADGAFYFGTLSTDTDIKIMEQLLATSVTAYDNAYARLKTMPYVQGNWGLASISYADVLAAQGKTQKAEAARERGVELYAEASRLAVNNPLFPYNEGKMLIALNRTEPARAAFESVLAIRTPYMDTYVHLARLALDRGEYATARDYVQKELQRDPGSEEAKALLQRLNSEAG